jgi:proton-translocating NADH-quinone oxidoreductase chain M
MFLFINIFSSIDLVFFYVFFEAVVVPMFLLIGVWGSRSRKVYASYLFFIYTLLSSVFILFCLVSINLYTGCSLFDFYLNSYIFADRLLLIWFLLFLGFAIKVPMLPLHIWLPEAHVEAPTPGSVILAGILLKLGSYAMLRLLLTAFTDISYDLIFAVLVLAFVGFTYASMAALSQIDIKKIIAYSSIAHMNFSLLGMFSMHILGLAGMFFLMFGHGVTSGALFLGVGVLYDRYKTRLIFYYGSLVVFMPVFSILYLVFFLSNFGFPGTSNFVGEFLILVGAIDFSNVLVFLSSFGIILSLIYSLFLYNRIFFGPLQKMFIRYYCDCSRLEFVVLVIFVVFVFLMGLFPGFVMFDIVGSGLSFELINF